MGRAADTATENILIMRGGALGDFVLTVPLLRCVRGAFPQARVKLAGHPEIAQLAVEEGLVDSVERVDSAAFSALFSDSPAPGESIAAYLGRFSRVIAVWRDPEGRLLRALGRAGARDVLHVRPIPPEAGGVHAIDYMLSQIPDDWRAGPRRPAVAPPFGRRRRARAFLRDELKLGRALVVAIHPGSGGRGRNRNWPPGRFAEVAEALRRHGGWECFVIRGPADDEAVAQMLHALGGGGVPVAGQLTVADLAAVLAEADAFVGNDSGVTHLAAAVGTRTVAVFGATDSALWAPRGRDVRLLKPVAGENGRQAGIESVSAQDVLDALGLGAE